MMTSHSSSARLSNGPPASNDTPVPEQTTSVGNIAPLGSPPGRRSLDRHDQTNPRLSTSTAASTSQPRNNRFSVTFPVQSSRSSRATSPVRLSHSPVREAPSVVPESLALLSGPSEPNFLTAIAAQERRVLELREELSKAEADLNKLKRQWAQHEAQRKRDDVKRMTKLQSLQTTPLQTSVAEDDSDGSNAWMQQEMERRKALLNSNPSSSRTVFSGSKHMRTLSLLSPTGAEIPQAPSSRFPAAKSLQKLPSTSESAGQKHRSEIRSVNAAQMTRASTTPDLVAGPVEIVPSEVDGTDNALDKDMLLKTSKKMATDLRDGLWTFWEDLRQATVGEEATKIEPVPRRQGSVSPTRRARRQGSKTSLRASSKDPPTAAKISTDSKRPPKSENNPLGEPSFWNEHGISTDQRVTPAKVKKISPAVRHTKSASKVSSIASSDNDGWEAWEDVSPLGSRASSAASDAITIASTVSNTTSPRTSTDVTKVSEWTPQRERPSPESSKKDPIPWPALSNLGPKALRRTASHLMAEWEKSLTSSPTKEDVGQGDYLGLGAEAAAVAVPSERKSDQASR